MYIDGIPPECYAGSGTLHSDIYQAGLTLYRAANGDDFFDRQRSADPNEVRIRTLAGEFPSRDRFMPHVPNSLRRVLRKALSPNPVDRYQSASDFADALGRADIALDWHARSLAGGRLEWEAQRAGRPKVIVALIPAGGSRCDVEFHTEGATKRCHKQDCLWKRGVTRVQAFAHLKSFFASAV